MNRLLNRFAAVGVFVLSLGGNAYSQPLTTPSQNPLAGSRVFGAKGCSGCHAINGIGPKVGPDLGRVTGARSFYTVAAAMWNHLPQMAAAMAKRGMTPPLLDATDTANLIGFLFTLNYFDDSGNSETGKRLFSEKRCVICHQIGGVGGVLGPSLDKVGRSATAINMATAMWNHGPEMAQLMQQRGIERPSLSAVELGDLIAYLRGTATNGGDEPVAILPGSAIEGRTLFGQKQCIKCHGIQGTGGKVGPDLGRRGRYRGVLEFAAALWNKAPAMIKAMKMGKVSIPTLRNAEMAGIVAYLRAFQFFDEPGIPSRGRQLLSERRCLSCHAYERSGGKTASDLAKVKGLSSPAAFISSLWNHVDLMAQPAANRDVSWPQLNAEEMTHLMALFSAASRSTP